MQSLFLIYSTDQRMRPQHLKFSTPLNKTVAILIVLLCHLWLLAQIAQGQDAKTRTWTAANGKYKIEATFEKRDGDKVVLRKQNGKTVSVKLSQLSKADREHVSAFGTDAKKTKTKPNSNSRSKSKSKPKRRGQFTVPGVFSVSSPGKGMKWEIAKEDLSPFGERLILIHCRNRNQDQAAITAVLTPVAKRDYEEIANDSHKGFVDSQTETVVSDSPPVKDRKRDNVYWSNLDLKLQNGAPRYYDQAIFFEDNAYYLVHSRCNNADTAAKLSEEVLKRIKEIDFEEALLELDGDEESEGDLFLPGYFRIPSPGKGYVWNV